MAIEYRVKVNLASGEIEVSGDRKFVDQKLNDLPGLLQALRNPDQAEETPAKPEEAKPAARKRGRKPGKSKVAKAKPAAAKTKSVTRKAKPAARKSRPAVAAPAMEINSANFKAEYKKFPKKLSQNDAVLLSGLFVQMSASDKKFTSADVDQLLNSVGKKISNTSVSLSQLRVGKRIERVGKNGRIVHYRVTPAGEDRLQKVYAKA